MSEYGLLSILPPVLAIFLAIRTKQVFVSLLFGIWLGWMIISWQPLGNPLGIFQNLFEGTLATIQALSLIHI